MAHITSAVGRPAADRHNAAPLALIEAKDRPYELNRRTGQIPRAGGRLTAVDLDEVLEQGRQIDAACDMFRLRYHPHRREVFTPQSTVCSVDRTGTTQLLFNRDIKAAS